MSIDIVFVCFLPWDRHPFRMSVHKYLALPVPSPRVRCKQVGAGKLYWMYQVAVGRPWCSFFFPKIYLQDMMWASVRAECGMPPITPPTQHGWGQCSCKWPLCWPLTVQSNVISIDFEVRFKSPWSPWCIGTANSNLACFLPLWWPLHAPTAHMGVQWVHLEGMQNKHNNQQQTGDENKKIWP